MKKVFIATLGCKVNQFESASFKTGFTNQGYKIVSRKEEADLVIINTCAVTSSAGAQSRQLIRKSLRKNPSAGIIITGCYAEIGAKEITQIDEIQGKDYSIVGNSKKDSIVTMGLDVDSNLEKFVLGAIDQAKNICKLPVEKFGERSRAYLRIQDGCENFCTYCIVPYTRGPSRSLPIDDVLAQANTYSQNGHKEIVLTGIHLGNYGKDLNPPSDIVEILQLLSSQTPEISYRISSLEPLEISTALLNLIKQRPNIQPHLHIPLQSGHDDVLKRMNRGYTTDQFKEIIDLCHSHIPGISIGIDILAGFPGETDEQFEIAKTFLQSLRFSYLHVFPYSKRPGTVAAEFPDQTLKSQKDKRVADLLSLSDLKQSEFNRNHLGQSRLTLIEKNRDKEGRLKGFTDNYIDVRIDGPNRLLNTSCLVKLLSTDNNVVIGELHEHNEN